MRRSTGRPSRRRRPSPHGALRSRSDSSRSRIALPSVAFARAGAQRPRRRPRCLATLGRFDGADVAYTRATDLENAAGFPSLVVRTRVLARSHAARTGRARRPPKSRRTARQRHRDRRPARNAAPRRTGPGVPTHGIQFVVILTCAPVGPARPACVASVTSPTSPKPDRRPPPGDRTNRPPRRRRSEPILLNRRRCCGLPHGILAGTRVCNVSAGRADETGPRQTIGSCRLFTRTFWG